MQKLKLFFISSVVSWQVLVVNAQTDTLKTNNPTDTISPVRLPPVQQETPKEPFSWRPDGIRIGFDALGFSRMFWDNRFKSNVGIVSDIQWGKWMLALEGGIINKQDEGISNSIFTSYSTQGNYIRIGFDLNTMHKVKVIAPSAVVVGLRYTRCNFRESVSTSRFNSDFGDPVPINLEHQLIAGWFDANFGLKAQVWKGLYMGYFLRYKLGIRIKGDTEFKVYEVPEYGSPLRSRFGFSYYLWWFFSFKK